MILPTYELFAIKYAERLGVRRSENFLGGDPHDGPMPMDYFIWVARDGANVILIDTGFDAAMAKRRNRTFVREPHEGLALLGIKREDIKTIVITHMHNDHMGTFFDFPNAKLHIQDTEMAYATGRCMCHANLARPYEAEHVGEVVKLIFKNRVMFHDGEDKIAPGIDVHLIGGHSAGLQAVRVHTKRGWVILASDSVHYYENIETHRCFPVVYHVGQMAEGYDKLNRLAESPNHIVPGHDPLVMKRYPPPSEDLKGAIVRLDVDPIA
jgi:glyoxylase-like metal-dependent hydrolase (beta-lactamase superfamily II)